jgi:ACS family hexuronate transporter-like MFS transporter
MKPKTHLRSWIVWTLFCSTVINYIDRQILSVLAPVIMQELHMTHEQYSYVVSAFQIAYACMWLVRGVIIDIIGTRLGLTVAMIWWSISSMLPALARSVFSLSIFRFMLGMGEGCNCPGVSKTVAEWFPAEERGLAVAIFYSGSSVGAIIAPPFFAFVAYAIGWRFAFLVAGSRGFLWLLLWMRLYRPLDSHPRLSDSEREFIKQRRATPATSAHQGLDRWLGLLRERNVWGIVLGRSLTDPIWWFYVFWLPSYFERHTRIQPQADRSLCLDSTPCGRPR